MLWYFHSDLQNGIIQYRWSQHLELDEKISEICKMSGTKAMYLPLSRVICEGSIIDINRHSADFSWHKLKISENTKVEKEAKALTTTERTPKWTEWATASLKGAEGSEWNRKQYTAPADSREKWSMRLWCGRSGYVIIFLYFLSCDKQVHVNFWGTYFQQDANRWQTFSLRRVRERPECLCSLPPLKQPQVQTKRVGYCHLYWKGTILNKYVCYTRYTRVYDP